MLVVAVLLPACNGEPGGTGGDEFAGKTCAMDIEAHGATDIEASPSEDPACITSHSTSDRISFAMVLLDQSAIFSLQIRDVMRGQVGTGFPAEATFAGADENEFESMECLVDLEEHELVGPTEGGQEYRVLGSGTCSDAIDGDGQTIVVEPFAFVVAITWAD